MGNYFSRVSLTTLTLAIFYKPCDVLADRVGYWAEVIYQKTCEDGVGGF